MTPLEKAAGVLERGTLINGKHCKPLAEMVITAFLEAAAEDEDAALSAGLAASRAEDAWGGAPNPEDRGKAAILALKETLG